jgi:hypothetical protein
MSTESQRILRKGCPSAVASSSCCPGAEGADDWLGRSLLDG